MIYSICFVISFLILWSGLLIIKKSDKKENVFVWGPIMFMGILCYHALIAGVINLINIPINILSLGIADLLFGVIIWWIIIKNDKRQQLEWEMYDIIAFAIIAITVFIGCTNQFGFKFDINYLTTDPGTHFRQALSVIQNKKIISMYFAPLNNALFLEVFQPFLRMTRIYRAFILADVIMYFISGSLFFCLIRNKLNDRYSRVIGILLTVVYMLGYPRNNMLFGFVYLGMGVSLVIFLMFMVRIFVESDENNLFILFFIMCGALSIGVCYSLFAPVVFFSICFFISWDMWTKRKQITKRVLKDITKINLGLFFVPCILILSYSMFQLSAFGSELSAGIAQEGFVYRELYSNFLFILPISLLGLYSLIKEKNKDVGTLLFFFLAGFMLVLAYLGTKGKVSSYYFYKNHYLMIMILFYLALYGALYIGKFCKPFIVIYSGIIMILAICWFGGLESEFQNETVLYVPEIKSNYFFHIYNFNRECLRDLSPYSENKIRLYEEYYEQYKNEEYVIFNGYIEDFNWFRGITRRVDFDNNIFWSVFKPEEIEELTRPGVTNALDKTNKKILEATLNNEDMLNVYMDTSEPKVKENMVIVVMNRVEGIADWKELDYADKLDVKYENAAGCIAILKNVGE